MTTVIEPTLFDQPTWAAVDESTASLLALIGGDPIHRRDRTRIVVAIQETANEHGGRVDPNELREYLWADGQCLVYPKLIGAVVASLRAHGRLVEDGWVVTTNSPTKNNGKPARVYRWRNP